MIEVMRRESLLTVLGVCLLAATFLLVVHLPGSRRTRTLEREIQQAEQTIRSIPMRIAELESLRGENQRRRAYLSRTEALVPETVDVPGVLREVTELAERAGLDVVSLKPQKLISYKSYSEYPFQIQLVGGFHGVAEFLYGLETSRRLFAVDHFELTGESDRPGPRAPIDATAQATVDFSVFTQIRGSADSSGNDASSTTWRTIQR